MKTMIRTGNQKQLLHAIAIMGMLCVIFAGLLFATENVNAAGNAYDAEQIGFDQQQSGEFDTSSNNRTHYYKFVTDSEAGKKYTVKASYDDSDVETTIMIRLLDKNYSVLNSDDGNNRWGIDEVWLDAPGESGNLIFESLNPDSEYYVAVERNQYGEATYIDYSVSVSCDGSASRNVVEATEPTKTEEPTTAQKSQESTTANNNEEPTEVKESTEPTGSDNNDTVLSGSNGGNSNSSNSYSAESGSQNVKVENANVVSSDDSNSDEACEPTVMECSDSPDSPKTGDNMMIIAVVLLMVIAAIVAIIVRVRSRGSEEC